MEVKNHTEYHPEPLLDKLVAALDVTQLRVEIQYISRSPRSGFCRDEVESAYINLGINPLNRYPFPNPFHTGEYYMLGRSRQSIIQVVEFGRPEELLTGVFLHELSHYQDFRSHLRPQYPEIRADKYALDELEKFGIGVRQPIEIPLFHPIFTKELEDSFVRLGQLFGIKSSPPTVHRLFDRVDIPSPYPLPKTETETAAQLKELDDFDARLPRKSKLKDKVRENRDHLKWHLAGLETKRRTCETRRELEDHEWAYVRVPQVSPHKPKYGAKVRVLTLGTEHATVEWEGKRRKLHILHLSAEEV